MLSLHSPLSWIIHEKRALWPLYASGTLHFQASIFIYCPSITTEEKEIKTINPVVIRIFPIKTTMQNQSELVKDKKVSNAMKLNSSSSARTNTKPKDLNFPHYFLFYEKFTCAQLEKSKPPRQIRARTLIALVVVTRDLERALWRKIMLFWERKWRWNWHRYRRQHGVAICTCLVTNEREQEIMRNWKMEIGCI